MKKILIVFMFLNLLFVFSISPVFAKSNNTGSGNSNTAALVPVFIALIIAIFMLSDPKTIVKRIVNQCNSNLDDERQKKKINSFLADEFILSGEADWLLKWKPGKIVKIKNELAGKNKKIVSTEFLEGTKYMFYLKKKVSGEKSKSTFWLVSKIEASSEVNKK